MNTNRNLKATVGTTKKSMETRSFAWFSRKARQVGDGGFLVRTMYFSTVALATVMPTLASFPTMRGDPQSGLALETSRIKSLRQACQAPCGRDLPNGHGTCTAARR